MDPAPDAPTEPPKDPSPSSPQAATNLASSDTRTEPGVSGQSPTQPPAAATGSPTSPLPSPGGSLPGPAFAKNLRHLRAPNPLGEVELAVGRHPKFPFASRAGAPTSPSLPSPPDATVAAMRSPSSGPAISAPLLVATSSSPDRPGGWHAHFNDPPALAPAPILTDRVTRGDEDEELEDEDVDADSPGPGAPHAHGSDGQPRRVKSHTTTSTTATEATTVPPDGDEADDNARSHDDLHADADADGFRLTPEFDLEHHGNGHSGARRKKRRRRPRDGDHSDHHHHHHHHHHDSHHAHDHLPPQRRRRKFTLAPRSWLDRLLFFWGIRLVCLLRNAENAHDVPLHLKASEGAKATGDALERSWKEECGRVAAAASTTAAVTGTPAVGEGSSVTVDVEEGNATGATTPPGVGSGKEFGSGRRSKYMRFKTDEGGTGETNGKCQNPDRSGPKLWKALRRAFGLRFATLAVWKCTKVGVQCRAALMVMIYRKSMRLSYVRGGVGDVVNLIANECNRIAEATVTMHYMWSAVAECATFYDIGASAIPALVLIVGILVLQYHIACRASVISFRSTDLVKSRVHLMSEILTAIKLIKFYAWESYYVRKIDAARAREMTELRAGMMMKAASCMVVFIAPVVVTLACLVAYVEGGAAPGGNGPLPASSVFTLLSLFNTLRYPLLLLPSSIKTWRGATESLKHLEAFFNLPEVDPLQELPPAEDADLVIDIKDADFVWDGDLDHPHITDLTLQIRRKQLIAVVGDLSSGKSLLAAIMGQIKLQRGTLAAHGTCGYVPQEPWLINATLRDNILFGLDYDEQRYLDVVRLCGLTRDLMLLSNGDESVVSELNLSSSQRQRLSLARCLYRDPDVILLEDCLSDFDQLHAKRLFKECIRNNLAKSKAVILVTQQKQFLPECDLILVLKNGRVVEQGTFVNLKARKVNFSAWVSDYIPIEDDPAGVLDEVNEIRLDSVRQSLPSSYPLSPVSAVANRIAEQSPKTTTTAIRSPFAQMRHAYQHKPSPLATADVIMPDPIELASVTTIPGGNDTENANQLTIRALMALNQQSIQNAQLNERTISKMIERNQLSVLTGNSTRPPANFPNQDPVTRTIEANQLTVHSAHGFNGSPIEGDKGIVTRSTGPTSAYFMYLREGYGRIIGILVVIMFFLVHGIRFFSDVWLIYLVERRNHSVEFYLGIYGALTTAIALGVFFRGTLFSQSVLKKSTTLHERCLRRVLRAPMSFYDITPLGQILSNFARHLFLVDDSLPDVTLQALSFAPIPLGTLILVSALVPWFSLTLPVYFILAYVLVTKCGQAEKKLRSLEAANKAPMFSHLSTTLEGLFSIRLYSAQDRFDAFNRILIDADHKALYSLMLIRTLQALYLDLISSLAIYLAAAIVAGDPAISSSVAGVAVSNVLQLLLFVQWLVRVGGDVHIGMSSVASVVNFTEHVPTEAPEIMPNARPPVDWPLRGLIEFKQVTVRYHQYGVAVLKSVSFKIAPGEKIGIVGRSGSGKTTLLVALLRIVEHVEGDIFIDGVDTSTVGLSDLRSRVAVIPQEPVLLTGTIRSNLDPFDSRSDEEVWKAVRDVHLGAKIEEMPLKLDTPIVENGRTFTLAERQLFCVARAILMKTRIVVFDEPTIAADNDTDALIQSTIRENFEHATVIVLASRFRMIAQADRIIVMEHGKIVEFDSPLRLLDNPRSKFSLMVSQTGDIDFAKLRQIAATKAAGGAQKAGVSSNSTSTAVSPSNGKPRLSVSTIGGNNQNGNGNGMTSSNGSMMAPTANGISRPTSPTPGVAGGSSPTLNPAVPSSSSYDSRSSVSTLGSAHSGPGGHLDPSSLPGSRRPTGPVMPRSLEHLFGGGGDAANE
ncbi:Multidrug resistance-associated protein 1 [Irineochytrium annulatum]|nr:Multidrug resistance-associated protein 1 [Irineochytrium annulatum]